MEESSQFRVHRTGWPQKSSKENPIQREQTFGRRLVVQSELGNQCYVVVSMGRLVMDRITTYIRGFLSTVFGSCTAQLNISLPAISGLHCAALSM